MSGAQGEQSKGDGRGDGSPIRESSESAPAKKRWSRDDRKWILVSSVYAIIVVVAILTTACMLPQKCTNCGQSGPLLVVGVTAQNGTYNGTDSWILIIASRMSTFSLDRVKATLTDANHVPLSPLSGVPLSDLTEANWATYHVLFKNRGQETDLAVGAKIIIDKRAYPGAEIMILTYKSFSGSGDLCRVNLP